MSNTRKVSRRTFLGRIAGAAGAGALGAWTPRPARAQGRVNVVWWRSLSGRSGDAYDEVAQRFNESQNRVTVQVEFQGDYGALRDKFAAAVVAGGSALPDLVMLADVIFPAFARNNILEPLDDLAKGSAGVDLKDYFGVLQRGVVGSKLYQFPLGVSTPILYYNQEAVRAAGLNGPPKTWDDLFNVYLPKLTKKEGGKTSMYGFAFLAFVDWWWQQSYMWMNGGGISDDKWNVYFDSPQVLDFLTRFQKAFQAGQAYIPTKAEGSPVAYFGSGKAALMVESTGVIGRLAEVVGNRFTAAVSYLPEGPKGRMVPTGGNGISIVAGRSPEKRQAAWELIRFSQQPQQVVRVSEMTGYLPYTKAAGAAMADLLAKEPNRKVALDQMAWSRPQSSIQTVPRAVDVYFDALQQVLQGGGDPKKLMAEVQKQVQTILVEDGYKK
jgi:sn-glycerol 3-phosphate transport system substrate-binding protein